MNKRRGFTLIELLVVIGIISILSSAAIVAINPARQFKLARDSKRTTDINSILNSIGQNMSEHKGIFSCVGQEKAFPLTSKIIESGNDGFDIAPCVVPDFLSSMPFDPNKTGADYISNTSYHTFYSIVTNSDGRISISAKSEIDPEHDLTATR